MTALSRAASALLKTPMQTQSKKADQMKYHVENGCTRNYASARLTRAQFINTLSSQRCAVCERIAFGGSVHRANLVARGEMIEARPGETLRLTRGGAEVVRHPAEE